MTEYATTALGDTVAYDRRGEGPGLVFIAGAGPFRATDPTTTKTAERAAELGVTTVVYDRLGRGESDASGRLDLERELVAIATMIDVAGGRAVLCGHSSGCAIALAAAHAGHPVTGLVLWEAPLGLRAEATREWIDEFERRLDADDHVGATEQFMRDMPPEWLEGMRQSPDFEELAKASVSQRADGQSLVWATAALEDRSLAHVDVPVLATYGTRTYPEMPESAEWIASVLPRVTVTDLPGADHTWEPESMAARLAEFTTANA